MAREISTKDLSAALAGRKRLEVDEVLANARRSKHERYEYLLAMQVLPPSKTRLERAAERVHPRAWPFSDSIVEQGLAGKDELVAIGRAMEAHDAQAAAEAEAPEPQNALLAVGMRMAAALRPSTSQPSAAAGSTHRAGTAPTSVLRRGARPGTSSALGSGLRPTLHGSAGGAFRGAATAGNMPRKITRAPWEQALAWSGDIDDRDLLAFGGVQTPVPVTPDVADSMRASDNQRAGNHTDAAPPAGGQQPAPQQDQQQLVQQPQQPVAVAAVAAAGTRAVSSRAGPMGLQPQVASLQHHHHQQQQQQPQVGSQQGPPAQPRCASPCAPFNQAPHGGVAGCGRPGTSPTPAPSAPAKQAAPIPAGASTAPMTLRAAPAADRPSTRQQQQPRASTAAAGSRPRPSASRATHRGSRPSRGSHYNHWHMPGGAATRPLASAGGARYQHAGPPALIPISIDPEDASKVVYFTQPTHRSVSPGGSSQQQQCHTSPRLTSPPRVCPLPSPGLTIPTSGISASTWLAWSWDAGDMAQSQPLPQGLGAGYHTVASPAAAGATSAPASPVRAQTADPMVGFLRRSPMASRWALYDLQGLHMAAVPPGSQPCSTGLAGTGSTGYTSSTVTAKAPGSPLYSTGSSAGSGGAVGLSRMRMATSYDDIGKAAAEVACQFSLPNEPDQDLGEGLVTAPGVASSGTHNENQGQGLVRRQLPSLF